jgi:hypothetical protein
LLDSCSLTGSSRNDQFLSNYLVFESNLTLNSSSGFTPSHIAEIVHARLVQGSASSNSMSVFSVVIDWQTPPNHISSFPLLSEVIFSPLPLLKLNGYALLGCHLISWLQHSSTDPTHSYSLLTTDPNNSTNTEVPSLTISTENHSTSLPSLPTPLYNDPILDSIFQFFEDLGRVCRENMDYLLTELSLTDLSYFQLEGMKKPILVWIDHSMTENESNEHISSHYRVLIKNLNFFFQSFGYSLVEVTEESVSLFQSDDPLLIFLPISRMKFSKNEKEELKILKFLQKKRRENSSPSRVMILTDGDEFIPFLQQKLKEEQSGEDDQEVSLPMILSLEGMVENMFDYVRQEIKNEIEKERPKEEGNECERQILLLVRSYLFSLVRLF